MLRIVLQRLLVSVLRFATAALALLVLTEFAFGVLGGSDRHVWEATSYGPVPPELSPRPVSWAGLFEERVRRSLPVLLLCVPAIFLIGYSWGVLGARLRRFHGARVLAAPFALLACVPGFWFVVLVAIHSYFHWGRPGFANDLVVERGPDLLTWWHAAIVALPALVAGAGWQIRAVSDMLEKEMTGGYVRGLFLVGYSEEDIFYRNAFRRALPQLFAVSSGTLSSVAGSLVCVEYAFRYPGIGSLLIESAKGGSYGGIFLSALALAALISGGVLLSEIAAALIRPEGADG
ncbi:MAG: ABC transporter permease subunit [Verrucomicrobiaceae bacterium]|nr:ABC transporter permease subunit [Verrucomicrobiaceae bacterium]